MSARPLTAAEIVALQRLDHLPDSAAVPIKLAALSNGTSERTWRRNPPIPTFPLSVGKKGCNVGLLRKLNRGELATNAA
ncbi:hypothetical protein XI09_26305 [Bradyrhizobium sp. CCBAU 11386]|uniref:hypothetical protein n=1 Tax=Bradyrhizobium sp. CCBAU 11386 TaxID=1630837 RepID=UPI002304858F|nr:hypothetical protein [Bradyrhizobium sp. CCBAU 11386]MDA9508087.1 hypothetical protein [Bradyrhizobium sp. CCBAU 11386]